MKKIKTKDFTIRMFARFHPEWEGRVDIKSPPHSREFTLLWDKKPIGIVKQFIPVGKSQGLGTCRFQTIDMDGVLIGPKEGHQKRLTAVEELIKRVQ